MAAARVEIKMLKDHAESTLAELTKLREENEMLASNNERLSEEKQILTEEVTKERQVNDELLTVKAALMEEKDGLTKEKNMLTKVLNNLSQMNMEQLRDQLKKVMSMKNLKEHEKCEGKLIEAG